MPRSCAVLVLVLLTACSDHADRLDDEELEVAAVPIGAYSRFPERRFAVGLQSEMRVYGDLGIEHIIREAHCLDESCTIEQLPNELEPRHPLFVVTAKAPAFRVHIELDERTPTVIERTLTAADGEMFALHRGPGPGVPFLTGMQVVWYVGTKTRNVSWDPSISSITVTPPFELVDAPKLGGGPDGDAFIRVVIRAPNELAATATGTLEHRNGDAVTSFALVAVPRGDVAKLRIAPAPDAPSRDDVETEATIAELARDWIRIPPFSVQNAWLVFESRDGRVGIAGAGQCLPAKNATFSLEPPSPVYYSFGIDVDHPTTFAPEDQPLLTLLGGGMRPPSQLILATDDVTNTVDVIPSEAQ